MRAVCSAAVARLRNVRLSAVTRSAFMSRIVSFRRSSGVAGGERRTKCRSAGGNARDFWRGDICTFWGCLPAANANKPILSCSRLMLFWPDDRTELKALVQTRDTRTERVFLVGVELKSGDTSAMRDSL